MKAITFTRWLSAVANSVVTRKTLLGVAGLAVVGGAIAGPTTGAPGAAQHPATTPAAVVQTGRPTPADRPAERPGTDRLIPHGVQGAQSSIALDDGQKANAKAIVEATKKTGLDERAAVIAVATSLQESKLNNYGDLGAANDHDSQGLFQQRPSSGWGTVEQITNPEHATTAFLDGLKQVDGWRDLPLTAAAQKVQVSAYPQAYAQWEKQAADLVADLWN